MSLQLLRSVKWQKLEVLVAQQPPGIMAYSSSRGIKRKLSLRDSQVSSPRPKRISPFHNTPIQRREEKHFLLQLSLCKLRSMENDGSLLFRKVLVNNIRKKVEHELREEKPHSTNHWWSHLEINVDDITNNNYEVVSNEHLLYNSHLFETDPDLDKVTKKMTVELSPSVDSNARAGTASAEHETAAIRDDGSVARDHDSHSVGRLNLSTATQGSDMSDATCTESSPQKCFCLSLCLCDCDLMNRQQPPQEVAKSTSHQSEDVFNIYSISSSSKTIFPSPECIPPLDFTSSSVSISQSSFDDITPSTATVSSLDTFEFDGDLDLLSSISNHETYTNDLDVVFNSFINVVAGSQ